MIFTVWNALGTATELAASPQQGNSNSEGTKSVLLRATQLLNIFKDGDTTISLSNLFWCSATVKAELMGEWEETAALYSEHEESWTQNSLGWKRS